MPLSAVGKLTVVASADLGGLGAKTGAPVSVNWITPSLAPQLIPWVMILGLLMLKANRTASAWLIWLPIACIAAAGTLPFPPSAKLDNMADVMAAFGFGLAAIWLLAGALHRGHRLLTFLCVSLALAGFSLAAFLFRQSGNLSSLEFLPFALFLGIGVGVSAVALSIAGWLCRRRYHPLGIYLWLFLLLLATWLAAATPIFLLNEAASSEAIRWSEFLIPVVGVALMNFALLLPFLVLSSASRLFRERFKYLLHMPPTPPPNLATSPAGPSSPNP